MQNITKNNDMTKFFQEILINGGKFLINNKSYEIVGPIDSKSKVRVSFLYW